MVEAFFDPDALSALPERVREAARSLVRVNTGRVVEHRVFASSDEASAWSAFVSDARGAETCRIGWTQGEIDALDLDPSGPDWCRGFVHELVAHLAEGGELPLRTPLTGVGAGVHVGEGWVWTNQHLVTGPLAASDVPNEVFSASGWPAPAIGLASVDGEPMGEARVHYVSAARDIALMRVPSFDGVASASSAPAAPSLHARVWMFGHPHRTNDGARASEFFGSVEASHALRVTPGLVVSRGDGEWFFDGHAAFGSSGSPVFDDTGALVGVYRGGWDPSLLPGSARTFRRVVDVSSGGPLGSLMK